MASIFDSEISKTFRKFSSWSDVIAYAREQGHLYYHAPLDRNPRYVRVLKIFKNGKIRLDPISRDADAFNADSHHLDRMRHK